MHTKIAQETIKFSQWHNAIAHLSMAGFKEVHLYMWESKKRKQIALLNTNRRTGQTTMVLETYKHGM
jgi:hypothetical protein